MTVLFIRMKLGKIRPMTLFAAKNIALLQMRDIVLKRGGIKRNRVEIYFARKVGFLQNFSDIGSD